LVQEIECAFVSPAGGIELRRVPRPSLEDGAIMVKMSASGICGTDLEKLTGKNITSPILGHEVSGIISESRSKNFREGELVVPHHHVACGACLLCKAGAETMCESFKASNFDPGGFATEFRVPEYNVSHGGIHFVPQNVGAEEASFAEPLGCCIRGIERALTRKNGQPNNPESILVVGAGPIGLLHMEVVKTKVSPAPKIVAVDISDSRLNFAEKFEGARVVNPKYCQGGKFSTSALGELGPHSEGFDLVIVATGNPEPFSEALRCVRKSGTVLLFGAPYKGATHSLDLAAFFLHEKTLTASYSSSDAEITEALSLLGEGKIGVKKFITSSFPFDKVSEAMTAARAENQVKVLVTA
jgi:L-iditol 2-dehydrogenase